MFLKNKYFKEYMENNNSKVSKEGQRYPHCPGCDGKRFWIGAVIRIIIVITIIIGAFKFGVHHGMILLR